MSLVNQDSYDKGVQRNGMEAEGDMSLGEGISACLHAGRNYLVERGN